jgi:hypothetical protein
MYQDFVTAIEAGIQYAPITLTEQGGCWYLYNPTTPDVGDDAPHLLVTETGTVMPLNARGSQVLQTFAFTGGHA